MSTAVCDRCGAPVTPGVACAACAFEAGETAVTARSVEAPSRVQAWWRSGRLSVVAAAGLLLASMALPLLHGVAMRVGGDYLTDLTVRPLDLALGTYPALRGRLSAWMLPGAAMFLLSLLRSRRTGSMMAATRPLLAAMSLAPLVALVLPILRLRDRGGHPQVGAALAVGALGVLFCWHAAAVFGNGVPERLPRREDADSGDA